MARFGSEYTRSYEAQYFQLETASEFLVEVMCRISAPDVSINSATTATAAESRAACSSTAAVFPLVASCRAIEKQQDL